MWRLWILQGDTDGIQRLLAVCSVIHIYPLFANSHQACSTDSGIITYPLWYVASGEGGKGPLWDGRQVVSEGQGVRTVNTQALCTIQIAPPSVLIQQSWTHLAHPLLIMHLSLTFHYMPDTMIPFWGPPCTMQAHPKPCLLWTGFCPVHHPLSYKKMTSAGWGRFSLLRLPALMAKCEPSLCFSINPTFLLISTYVSWHMGRQEPRPSLAGGLSESSQDSWSSQYNLGSQPV